VRELTDAERSALGPACERLPAEGVVLHRSPGDALRALVLLFSGDRAVTLGRHVFLPSRCDGDPSPGFACEKPATVPAKTTNKTATKFLAFEKYIIDLDQTQTVPFSTNSRTASAGDGLP